LKIIRQTKFSPLLKIILFLPRFPRKDLASQQEKVQTIKKMPSRVFIVQQPRPKSDTGWVPNFETATQYGALHFIFDQGDRAYADPEAARCKAVARLADFNPEQDYLLWASFGDPACLWLVIMMLACRGYSKLRFLYWSRGRKDGVMSNEAGYYFPIELNAKHPNDK
jgi:hypothetical protein